MKVIKVDEVIGGLEKIIDIKTKEKEQILSIRDGLNKIIDLNDALKGEGGDAIKEHFMTLHFPAVTLFNLFLEEYIKVLEQIKKLVLSFENENGVVREEFIESDIKNGLTRLEDLTHEIVNDINSHYNEVSDLVPNSSVRTSQFDYQIASTRTVLSDTLTKFADLDENSTSNLQSSSASLDEISAFISKIKGWTKNGVFLTSSQIEEVEDYFLESNVIQDMIDSATKLSVEQGDSTIQGEIATWLSNLGKFNGAYNVAKGALAFQILNSGMLTMEKDGKGNFIVRATDAWTQNKSGKYNSKLAERVYKLLQYGDKNSINPLKRYIGKAGRSPSGVLREIIGLNSATNRIGFGKIADSYSSSVLVFDKNELKNYGMKVDVKGTANQLSTQGGLAKFAKRIPYVGIAFSIGTNSGEYYSDENKHKSGAEKTGRFAAGIGLDAGVAGVTTVGAGIGTLICPGVGTIIGGAVGAGVGIVGSWLAEDTVKDWGESAGRWVDDRYEDVKDWGNDAVDWVEEKSEKLVSSVGDFVSGIFN
ncbi:LXG domain-containing protein [Oceanobacillus kimchii]|uniref:LXG domain-containing protein n=1 Tax=Oceanobacillus kimchii TaxID=746691 RepID=UPI00034B9027|nr:LXG domain-containing protein [Oceanobacillus kimchii]